MTKGKLFALALATLPLTGCLTDQPPANVRHAVVQLNPASGSDVRGTVHFYELKKGMRVVAEVTGLTPGKHGFHIHDKGDCSAPDATSAGPHFNPGGLKHGGPETAERHVGDLGNIIADAAGKGRYDRVDAALSFDGTNGILGRAVIVHATVDDLTSQPAGNAGARIACGKIELK
jgi:Cu-Zn family superoxide dismutase